MPQLVTASLKEQEDEACAKLPEAVFTFLRRFAALSESSARWTVPILPPLQTLFDTGECFLPTLKLIWMTGCSLIMHFRGDYEAIVDSVRASGIQFLTYDPISHVQALVKTEPGYVKTESASMNFRQ